MGVYPNSVLCVNLGVIGRFYLISDAHVPLMRQVASAICRQCGGFSGAGTISETVACTVNLHFRY